MSPNHDEIILRIEAGVKIIGAQRIEWKELLGVLEKCKQPESILLIARCLAIKGEFDKAFRACLLIKKPNNVKVEVVLKMLRRCWSMLLDTTLLNQQ